MDFTFCRRGRLLCPTLSPFQTIGLLATLRYAVAAMSMAVLGTLCAAPVTIDNVECVQTSYPAFWDDLALLTGAGS